MFNKVIESLSGKKQWYKMGQLLPILSANALLADRRYVHSIEQVKALSLLPDEHFNHFYHGFIQRFAEFVQVIPDKRDEPLGSLLVHGLLRGVNTLHVFVEQFQHASPLERYALFTACVLRDVSSVVVQQKVLITDAQGSTIHLWQPFCGPMTEEEQGSHYKILPLSSAYERIGKLLRITLARQVMGEGGYLWIASDLRLLTEWLEALDEEDDEGSGRLVKAIKLYRSRGTALIDSLPLVLVDLLDSPATKYADQFYSWLLDGLESGRIKVNSSEAEVHVTEAGVFVETSAIFKTFAETFKLPGSVVFTQLGNLLGIARQGGNDFQYAQLFSEYPDAASSHRGGFSGPLSGKAAVLREGVLLSDPNALFLKGKVPPITPHIKLPASIRRASSELADFNEATKPNSTMKYR